MDEILKRASQHPLFQQTFATGLSSITNGAQILMALGIDVSEETRTLLSKIEEVLRNATYDSLDLDELLAEAQAIGEDIGEEKNKESSETLGREESNDSS